MELSPHNQDTCEQTKHFMELHQQGLQPEVEKSPSHHSASEKSHHSASEKSHHSSSKKDI